jgi:hypothetical protein
MYGHLISGCVHGLQLFVGGLDLSVTDEDLKKAFSPYGEITDVKVIRGRSMASPHILAGIYFIISMVCSVHCCGCQLADQ